MVINAASRVAKSINLKCAFLLIVGIIALFLSFKYAGFSETIRTLFLLNPIILGIFILSRAAIYLLSNYRWKIFVDKIEKIGFAKLLPIYFSGMILDNLIPGPSFGGEPVKAYYLSKLTQKKFSHLFATALMDSIVFSLALLGFLTVSIVYVFLYIKIPVIHQSLILIIIVLVAAFALLYYFYSRKNYHTFVDKILGFIYKFDFLRKKFAKYEHFKEHLKKSFSEFMLMMRKLFATKETFLFAILISFLTILINIWSTQFLVNSFGLGISFMQIMIVVIISEFIGFYSTIPGGTGATEGSMIILLKFIGISAGIAGAVTLISRMIFYFITYGIGYISLLYVNFKYVH